MSVFNVNTVPADMSRNSQVRRASEIIYGSLSNSDQHQSGSARHRVPIPWDHQACCGIMSPVRRTFCLFVTFDLILIFVVWVIYTQVLPKKSTWERFIDEVEHYTFQESLFDSVLCAGCRMVPLQLAYALFRIRNPYVVAGTTGGTSLYVLVKVFIFKFNDQDHNNVICYLLLIVSFIIAWIEVWFLDFKVLPQEQKWREREYTSIDERSSLLNSGNNYPGPLHPPLDHFYSPIASRDATPGGSDDEGSPTGFHSVPNSRGHSRNSSGSFGTSLGTQEQEYLQKAEDAWDKAWEILHSDEGWKKETGSSLDEGVVFSRHFPKLGKLFKLEAYLEASQDLCFEELVVNCDKQPEWNGTLLEARCLQQINDCTDIYYTIANEAAGGLVSSRDFVSLRHWATKDGIILSAGCAVMHPDMPPQKQHVRGENRPGGWIFKPIPGEPKRCIFIWIINTDLKGWIPQYAVDQALSGTLLEFVKHVRKRITVLDER